MTRRLLGAVAAVAIGSTLSATGGKVNGGGATGTEISLRIPDEAAPAGGTVQMKVMTTEVTPISGGRPRFSYSPSMFEGVLGFGMMASNGEIAGAAIVDGTRVQIVYDGTSLLTGDYPILTVVLPIRSDAIPGWQTAFTLDNSSLWNYSNRGPSSARISPGTVTVKGTTSISDVIPGEGVWPAGTVVTVRGTGFDDRTSVRVNDSLITADRVVSPTELQFDLAAPSEIRGLKITVSGAQNAATYYAYMRGITKVASARTLLASVEPIFSTAQRTRATLAPALAMSGGQYEAVALQNPNPADVAVGLSLRDADGTVIYETARTLAARERLALEASELLDGVAPPAGSTIVVTSSQPIDAFSLLCDEATASVVPVLPLEAQR